MGTDKLDDWVKVETMNPFVQALGEGQWKRILQGKTTEMVHMVASLAPDYCRLVLRNDLFKQFGPIWDGLNHEEKSLVQAIESVFPGALIE